MKSLLEMIGYVALISILGMGLIVGGCSSGGGGSSSGGASSDTGSVGIYLTDAPSDDYDHFWVWLKTIKIYPENGSEPIMIYEAEDPDGDKVDLLDLEDRELLLGITSQVPVGSYNKLGIEFGDIKPEGTGVCATEGIVVNESIDYAIDFEVTDDGTTTLHIDIDIEKSLEALTNDEGTQCEFFPVLFVEFDQEAEETVCQEVVTGIVGELLYEADGTTIKGFTLKVREPWFRQNGDGSRHDNEDDDDEWYHSGGAIDVLATSGTTLYDVDGTEIGLDGLEGRERDRVIVRGFLDYDGYLNASLIVFGSVKVFKGTVSSSTVDDYKLSTASGNITVSLGDESVILTRCDEEWPQDTPIPPYYFVRVYGKFIGDNNQFLGIINLIRPQDIKGDLVKIEASSDANGGAGYDLTVERDDDSVVVFLPEDIIDQIFVKPDWPLELETLMGFIDCDPRKVQIVTDPDITDQLTAKSVTVQPETISGTIKEIDEDERVIATEEGDVVYIPEGAVILKQSYSRHGEDDDDNDNQADAQFSDLSIGDKIKGYGLLGCPEPDGDVIFNAYTLIGRSSHGDTHEPDSLEIYRNKVTIWLQAETYPKDVIIKGNKVRLMGQAGDDCEDEDGWTIIDGDVKIMGNKSELHNMIIKGNVMVHGNNTIFNNVVFEGIVVDDGNNTKFKGECTNFIPGDDDDDDDDDD